MVDSQALTADEHFGGGVGAADLQEVALSCRQVCLADGLDIHAVATEVVIVAVLAVDCVPGMGQVHRLPLLVDDCGNCGDLLGKCPIAVDIYDLSHKNCLLI